MIQGHDIVAEDIRNTYNFAGEKSKELSEKYEDHSFSKIITMFSDYIQTSSKTPIRPMTTDPKTYLKKVI